MAMTARQNIPDTIALTPEDYLASVSKTWFCLFELGTIGKD